MPLGYELVGSINVSSAATQVDFIGLNFTSEDELLLVVNQINPQNNFTGVHLSVNNRFSPSLYKAQRVFANGSSVAGDRFSESLIGIVGSANLAGETNMIIRLKLTETGYFTWQSSQIYDHSKPSSMWITEHYGTSLFLETSITSLSISAEAGTIGVGSSIKLYKLVAKLLAGIPVLAATSQVDIAGLGLGDSSELLLVGHLADANSSTGLSLYFNGNTIATNYYNQAFTANGTSISAARANNASCVSYSDDTVLRTSIKLSNGLLVAQTHSTTQVGGGSVSMNKKYATSTFAAALITQITIVANTSGGIGIGSNFKLYQLK